MSINKDLAKIAQLFFFCHSTERVHKYETALQETNADFFQMIQYFKKQIRVIEE